jgi:hypothetical protein
MVSSQLTLPFATPLAGIFTAAHHELRPRTPVPDIDVEFFPFAGINHTARLNRGRLSVRVSDLFNDAPGEVHHALAVILLAKLYRKKIDASYHRTYRGFILRHEIQERAREARSSRGRAARLTRAQGVHIDLDGLFVRLNSTYFRGQLDKPAISWSAKRSKRILGRYDATHHAIFISRIFDSARIPDYVVEYVMYHEMLHLKHQTRVKDCRLIVHTPEFKEEERRFARYDEVREWLKGF